MALIIPEVQLCTIIDALLKHIKLDFEAKVVTPEKSLLYNYFNGIVDHKKDYYKEAVDLFTREADHPRLIETRLAFDAERAKIPTIHITMPSDQTGQNSLGIGESGMADYVNYIDGEVSVEYERRFDTQYQIVCTSDQHSEVMLMYHLVRAGLISILDTFSLTGLEDPKLSGQELKINPDLMPSHIFMRAIGVSFSYEIKVSRWWNEDIINDLCLDQNQIYDNEQ